MMSRCTVRVPSPLRSYTQAATVEASGGTVDALLRDLDARFPGMRFRMIDEQGRIRAHMRIFVDSREVRRIEQPLSAGSTVHLLCALSGG